MKMFMWKPLSYALFIQLDVMYAASGTQTFMTSFQSNIKDNTLASSDVWIEFSNQIPQAKEFTVCHWIKLKFYNSAIAACLWSYCTVENSGDKMDCLQVCIISASHTLNRNLMFQRSVKLSNQERINLRPIELPYYRHRTWTHLCWSYSAQTGESKYYHNGAIFDKERLNVTNDDVALKGSSDMHDFALIFGQEQDKIRGGFEKGQAYLGDLSEFNIWNHT